MLFISLVIASCGLSSVLIINNSAKQSYNSNNQLLVSGVSHQIVSSNPQQPLSKQDYAQLRKQGFVQLIAIAQARTHLFLDQQQVTKRSVVISGIDTISLLSASNRSNDNLRTPENLAGLNAMSFAEPFAIVHKQLLSQLLAEASESNTRFHLPLSNDQLQSNLRFLPPLVGIDQANLGNDVIVDIGEFFTLYPDHDLSRLLFSDTQASEQVIKALKAALPTHLKLEKLDNGEQEGELTESFHLNLMAMALLMFVVCLFIVLNAVNLLINARMPWLKICRQLGISRHSIFSYLSLEIVFLTFLATCLGILLSIDVANWASPSVQATLEGLYGVELGFGNVSIVELFIQVFAICVCGSLLAIIAPFVKSNRSLTKKDNYSVQHQTPHASKVFWLFFGICSLLAIVFVQANSLSWLLFSSALLILAGCCFLMAVYPLILSVIKRLIPQQYHLLRLSVSQSIALSAKTKVACCAFFIAVTSNIGMNLMVDSFRNATQSWLESRLTAEYYLYYEGEVNVKQIAATNNISIQQRFENTEYIQGLTVQKFSYPTTDRFKEAMVFFDIQDETMAWQQFENGQGVFVNQQYAFYFDKQLGDPIRLNIPRDNEQQTFTILGIIYDFGNPNKQVLMPVHMFDESTANGRIYAIDGAPTDIAAFKDVLDAQGINSENMLLPAAQLLELSMTTFNRTFLITDGLNIITLLVAALSLACAIIVLMKEEQAQRMLIRSLGVSQVSTIFLAFFRYLMLCCVALVLATPFGMLLSWLLIYKINLQAFQWTYPLQVDPLNILIIYAVSLLVVAVVILIPIISASRRPLIEDIRCLN